MPLVASPAQFDRTPPRLSHAPEFGADTDDVLAELGLDSEQVMQARIAGAVV
jgi:crotonobetainyl-CoA:carnitine CoA-transferase CaiB-like acyl-CoA transferase